MVGVGLIFIPTLPPPFGEVLIVGGVSVLGTEFEGPKRVMKSARDSLERAVGRDNEPEKITEGDTEPNSPEPETDTETESIVEGEALESDKSQQPTTTNKKTTMGDRFKSFGRRHVLPFLDQVVGDRNEVHNKTNSVANDSSAASAEVVNDSNKVGVANAEPGVVAAALDQEGVESKTS